MKEATLVPTLTLHERLSSLLFHRSQCRKTPFMKGRFTLLFEASTSTPQTNYMATARVKIAGYSYGGSRWAPSKPSPASLAHHTTTGSSTMGSTSGTSTSTEPPVIITDEEKLRLRRIELVEIAFYMLPVTMDDACELVQFLDAEGLSMNTAGSVKNQDQDHEQQQGKKEGNTCISTQ